MQRHYEEGATRAAHELKAKDALAAQLNASKGAMEANLNRELDKMHVGSSFFGCDAR